MPVVIPAFDSGPEFYRILTTLPRAQRSLPKRNFTSKALDLRGIFLGILPGGLAVISIGAAVNRRSEWEYRIIGGYHTQTQNAPNTGSQQLETAGTEGWKTVSWTQDESTPRSSVH